MVKLYFSTYLFHIILTGVILITPFNSHAYDNQIKKAFTLSTSSYIRNYTNSFISLDDLTIENADRYFYDAAGKLIFSSDKTIYSLYDRSVTANADDFFKKNNYRFNFTGIFKTNNIAEIILFGFDSGASSEKININPAIKLGYVNSFKLSSSLFFTLGFSRWYGGQVSETPCVDVYDRLYSCRYLISWLDVNPLSVNHHTSYAFRLTYLY